MRDTKLLPPKRSRALGLQRKCELAPEVNLPCSLSCEMYAAEPMCQRSRHRERRPLVGINSSMHAKQTALAKLPPNGLFTHPLFT